MMLSEVPERADGVKSKFSPSNKKIACLPVHRASLLYSREQHKGETHRKGPI